ncbi:lipid-A-disaccharide synthase [Parahalioglobus pacificus]|uniref:Lipid-A-disaccharide synthase n=1 Tax=Parahalioglobus pacificus TaxID=930806 RepID=A0A918XHW1_9GAMM|nr:lipid-A-disaccharide synthase [Halioglobus pacificus]GHD32411.1 lipid-A-disaccharide synthase [Halioglobus pacificus]
MTAAPLRIGILAGEASGDILGSRVVAALRSRVPDLIVEGIGGPLLAQQGLDSLFPMERLSVMGFVEPLKRLPELLNIRKRVFEHFRDNPPDLFLGIDSPDFNLTLERQLRECGIPVAHLVSPTVWAWRQKRIHKIARSVDLMLCLFPFEQDIYQQHDIPCRFVGHPLADELPLQPDRDAARAGLGIASDTTVLAVLPGSRGGEVAALAPLFLEVVRRLKATHPALHVLMPAANSERMVQLKALLAQTQDLPVTLVQGESREVMAAADAVLLASGTATLEAMLLKRPMVVAYRMSSLSWALVIRLVQTPFAALPNILAGKALVPEFIQDAATAEGIASAVNEILEGTDDGQLQAFEALHRSLRLDFASKTAEALLELAGRNA